MSGDATLFARRDEVEEAWAFIDIRSKKPGRLKRTRRICHFIRPGRGARNKPTNLLARDGRPGEGL